MGDPREDCEYVQAHYEVTFVYQIINKKNKDALQIYFQPPDFFLFYYTLKPLRRQNKKRNPAL